MEAFYQISFVLGHFVIFIVLFGVRRVLEMILSHRAPSNINMSSYRTIWTHFRQNSMIIIDLTFKNNLSELQISRRMDAEPS